MDDLAFVQRCINKDSRAWEEFVEKYSRLIYNYIHSVLKVTGVSFVPENVNDLFQEIFLSLVKDDFKKLRTFKGRNGCSLASWLRQVTVNFTISYLRRIKPTVSLDAENEDGFGLKDTLADGSVFAPEVLSDSERLEHLKECIERLDNHEKYLLELYINKGLRLEEIRSRFRLSRSAVDMQKSRIVNKLRDCFKSKGILLDS